MERARLQEIEWESARLVTEFYSALDEKRYEDLADLFAPEGVWSRLGRDLKGSAEILESMSARTDWLTAHVLTNVRVQVTSPDRCETTQYITLYRHEGWAPDSGPAAVSLPLGVLKHWDTHVLINGVWKIARKTSRAIMVDRIRVTHYDKA